MVIYLFDLMYPNRVILEDKLIVYHSKLEARTRKNVNSSNVKSVAFHCEYHKIIFVRSEIKNQYDTVSQSKTALSSVTPKTVSVPFLLNHKSCCSNMIYLYGREGKKEFVK